MTKFAGAAKYRLLVPDRPDVTGRTVNLNGGGPNRLHAGELFDVDRAEASRLEAIGCVNIGPVGASEERPEKFVAAGNHFHDTTAGKTIVFDGKVWRDPFTGAAV